MSTMEKRVRGLRGAITVDRNEEAEIVATTVELLHVMMERNGLQPDDIISIVFTATADLDAGFSAAAARSANLSSVPVIGAMEVGVSGALERCVRILMHIYTDADPAALHHPYLKGARSLPSDLPE